MAYVDLNLMYALTTPRESRDGDSPEGFQNFRLVGLIGEVKYASMGCSKASLYLFLIAFYLSPMEPLCYRHFCVMQVCPHGMLSPFHSGYREGNSTISLRLKPHESRFRPGLKSRGYHAPGLFHVHLMARLIHALSPVA